MDEGQLNQDEAPPVPRVAPPRAPFTISLLAINLVVFAAMAASGVGLFMPKAEALVAWGADYGPATTSGEWWRLLTSAFVHVGVVHLFVNMWALYAVGPLVERLYGGAPFAAIYVTAALSGSLASILRNPDGVSAGASGALFGVLGALGAFLFTHRGVIEPRALKALRSNVVSVIGLNLAIGFLIPFVDNMAHIGGLAGGALAGLAAGSFRAQRSLSAPPPLGPFLRVLAAGTALTAVLVWIVPHRTGAPAPGASPPPGAGDIEAATEWLQQEGARLDRVNADLNRRRREGISPEELARLYEEQVVPGWDAAAARFQSLSPEARQLDPELVALVVLQRDAMRALVIALRTRQPEAVRRFNRLKNELEERSGARRKALGIDQPAEPASPSP